VYEAEIVKAEDEAAGGGEDIMMYDQGWLFKGEACT